MRVASLSSALTLVLALALAVGTGCATMNARSAYNRGQAAYKKGQLDEAIEGYRQAAAADPKKPEYKRALDETRTEALNRQVEAARAAEEAGDYPKAVKHWDGALKYSPESGELKARRELALLHTKQADPVELFEAAKKLVESLPGDPTAKKILDDAKAAAVAYHLRLADTYAEAKSWERAHAAFEGAKKVDPDNAIFKGATYKGAEARYLEGVGDERSKANDPVGAYQAYEKAGALKSTPALEAKLKAAKRGAGSILEQYQQAKTAEEKGQWEEAAELYSLLSHRSGAPADVPEHATKTRKESARLRAERAKGYAERGTSDKATAELTLALEHSDGPKPALTLVQEGIEALSSGKLGDAKGKLEKAKELAADLPVVAVAPFVLTAVAQAELDSAKRLAESAPADALLSLRRLEPLSATLKGLAELKAGLVKKAFGALVEKAEKQAAEGRLEAAADLLVAALEVSKPPKELAEQLKIGADALTKRDWDTARDAFDRALATNGKSNIARVGRKVAGDARLAELKKDAKEAKAAEDTIRAAAAYRAILAIDPNDADAKAGAEELRGALVSGALESAKANEAAGKTGAAYVYYRRVLDLDPKEPESKAAVAAIAQQLAKGEEAEGFVAPISRSADLGAVCPAADKELRETLVLYLNRTRKLGAEYLRREDVAAIDANKRGPAPVVLRAVIERCDLEARGGTMQVAVVLELEGDVVAKESAVAKFDPTSVPKDELQDGLSPKRVEKALVAEAAKVITNAIRPHAQKLADWRALAAAATLKAGDAEGCARAYAVLSSVKSPTESERKALRDLERFLLNRYR